MTELCGGGGGGAIHIRRCCGAANGTYTSRPSPQSDDGATDVRRGPLWGPGTAHGPERIGTALSRSTASTSHCHLTRPLPISRCAAVQWPGLVPCDPVWSGVVWSEDAGSQVGSSSFLTSSRIQVRGRVLL